MAPALISPLDGDVSSESVRARGEVGVITVALISRLDDDVSRGDVSSERVRARGEVGVITCTVSLISPLDDDVSSERVRARGERGVITVAGGVVMMAEGDI